ncbi:MAG: SH3 domain-containing protein [Alphaproteobacteria bacterium]
MIQSANRYLSWIVLLLPFLMAVMVLPGTAAAQTVQETYVTTADVNLRKGPGTKYEVVTIIPKNVKISVVGRDGYWLKVESKHGGKPGYIDERYATPVSGQRSAQTTTSPLATAGPYRTLRETDLREGPALTSKVITKLPANIKIYVARSEGEWLRVESKHGGRPGYVQRQSAEPWRDR